MNTKKKILVVDDEEMNCEFFDLMLGKLGFTVELARDGEEGFEKVKSFFPDLILLDNLMPRMSGWELTKKIKSEAKYKNISVIMLSALDDVKDKVEGFELGVDDYITKPFNFSEVLVRIRAVLRNRELMDQMRKREGRLALAENLNADVKKSLLKFVGTLDDLDKAAAATGNEAFKAKTLGARKIIAELDARIEKTLKEWDELKKDEIGMSALEEDARGAVKQDKE